jgi:phosphoglycolate phosphatase-like HAD superfamily hydrolase
MTRAFEDLFAIPNAFHDTAMPGRTDSWILGSAARAHGIDHALIGRFRDVYLRHLGEELQRPGPRKGIMPGVRSLLDRLHERDDVHLALLTGNYEAAARQKLEHFDLWRYFKGGAFGDDTADRNDLLPAALEQIRACGGPDIAPASAVVIGDTPLDIACAAAWGARSIAVATGGFDVDALRAAGADVVFDTLTDTEAVVDALTGEIV